jgi:acylphosphatase
MRFYISGRVQGVWFRGSTQKQAQQVNITGYARNLDDGRVEVVACGAEKAVAALQNWLWQGPSQARVEAVEAEVIPYRETTGFEVC